MLIDGYNPKTDLIIQRIVVIFERMGRPLKFHPSENTFLSPPSVLCRSSPPVSKAAILKCFNIKAFPFLSWYMSYLPGNYF